MTLPKNLIGFCPVILNQPWFTRTKSLYLSFYSLLTLLSPHQPSIMSRELDLGGTFTNNPLIYQIKKIEALGKDHMGD